MGQGREGGRGGELHRQADEHDHPPVLAVGGLAGEQGQGEHRQKLGQAQHAHGEGALGDRAGQPGHGIDVPGQGDGLDLGGQVAQQPRRPHPHIGPLTQKRAQGRRVDQGRFGGHHGLSRLEISRLARSAGERGMVGGSLAEGRRRRKPARARKLTSARTGQATSERRPEDQENPSIGRSGHWSAAGSRDICAKPRSWRLLRRKRPLFREERHRRRTQRAAHLR